MEEQAKECNCWECAGKREPWFKMDGRHCEICLGWLDGRAQLSDPAKPIALKKGRYRDAKKVYGLSLCDGCAARPDMDALITRELLAERIEWHEKRRLYDNRWFIVPHTSHTYVDFLSVVGYKPIKTEYFSAIPIEQNEQESK